jgi:TRAP-type C4-dicarboxylate transport system permease small subunit
MHTAPSDGIAAPRLPSALVLFSRILGVLSTLALWIAAIGLVLMTAFVAWQVWGRYVLNASPAWTEPAAIVLMGWFIFLGAAVGVRENYHLGFEVLLAISSPRVSFAMRCVSDVVTGGFGAAMAWYGMTLTIGTWTATLPTLGLPGGVDYMPIVGGGALILLFSLERIVRRFALGPGREDVSWNS